MSQTKGNATLWSIVSGIVATVVIMALSFATCDANKKLDMAKSNMDALRDSMQTVVTDRDDIYVERKALQLTVAELNDIVSDRDGLIGELRESVGDGSMVSNTIIASGISFSGTDTVEVHDTVYVDGVRWPVYRKSWSEPHITGWIRMGIDGVSWHIRMPDTIRISHKRHKGSLMVYASHSNPYIISNDIASYVVPNGALIRKFDIWAGVYGTWSLEYYDIHPSMLFGIKERHQIMAAYGIFNKSASFGYYVRVGR